VVSRQFRRFFAFGSDLHQREALRRRFLPRVEALEDRLATSATASVAVSAPSTVLAGNNLTYTLSLTNSGPDALASVTLSDLLPSGVTWVSQTQTSGPSFSLSEGSGTVTDTISSMPSGSAAAFNLVVSIPANTGDGTFLSDSANFLTSTSLTGSSTTSASASTTVQNKADIQVTQTGPSTAAPGTDLTYAITVSNNGPDPALNTTLTDTLPTGLTLVSQTQTSGPSFTLGSSSGTLTDTYSALASGASATFQVVALLSSSASDGSTVGNTASATTASTDPNIINNSAGVTTTVHAQADIQVTQSGQALLTAGSYVSYDITVSNAGPNPAQSVSLADTLPTGETLLTQTQLSGPTFSLSGSSSGISDMISSLSAGASASFLVTAQVGGSLSNGSTLRNTASANSMMTSDPNTANNSATLTSTVYTYGPVRGRHRLAVPQRQLLRQRQPQLHRRRAAAGTEDQPEHRRHQRHRRYRRRRGPVHDDGHGRRRHVHGQHQFHLECQQPRDADQPRHPDHHRRQFRHPVAQRQRFQQRHAHLLRHGVAPGLKINTSTGAITGTMALDAAAGGPYSVTVTAEDGTYSASQTFTWNVTSPVTLSAVPDQTSTEGASVTLSLSASDSSSGTLSYGAVGLPPGLKINTSTGAITGTIALAAAAGGPYSVTVTAGDGTYSASRTFTWNINSPVTITTPADQTSSEGASVSLSISATDASSGTVTFGAVGLPGGLSINAGTGAITGTVATGAAADGPYTVTLLAADGTYSATTSFTWTVNSPVTITTPDDQSNAQGDSPSLTLSASTTGSGTISYSAAGLPPGLTLNTSTGAITGTLTAGGSFQPTVTASAGGSSASTSFAWAVSSPVTITDPGSQAYNAGDAVSLQVQASTTGSGTLTYSATGLPSGLSINSSTGALTGTASDGGFWEPTVTASDGTYSNSVTFDWTVTSPVTITDPGDQFNSIGDTVSFSVAAADTSSGTLSYSATGLPTGLSINSSTGLISGTVSTSASTTTPYTTVITVSDGTSSAVDTLTWTIYPAGPVVLSSPGNQTNAVGDEVLLPIEASDSSGGTLLYTATGLPAGLYMNLFTGEIFGTPSATTLTPASVTVKANDGTNSATLTFTWTVNAAGTVSMVNPGDQTTSEGNTVSLAISATDSGSGTLRYAAFGLPPGLAINTSTGAITGTIAAGAAANGPYPVTVVANDGTYSASQTFLWTVDSPVTLTAPGDQTNDEGGTVSLSLSASDATGGTLTYSAAGLPPGLKLNPSTGTITGTAAVGAAADGPYTVTVAAADGTYSAAQTFTWTVNSPISITAPDDQSNNDGDSASVAISASDAVSGTLTYSAQGLPPGLSINPTTGAITGMVTAGASGLGSYFPTVVVSDGTYSDSMSFEWDVNSLVSISDPGDQVNTVGDTVSLALSATDAGSGTLTYVATGLPAGLSLNPSTGVISGTISSGATAIGSYTTTIFVGDGTYSAVDSLTWTITAAGTVTLATPNDQSSSEGASASLSLSASDSGSGTLSYFALGLPAGLKLNPTTGAMSGTVAVGAAATGPDSVTVIATDGTNSAEETFLWTPTSAVTMAAVADQTNAEGDTVSLSVSASDSGGGTLTFAAVGLPAGVKINPSTGAITGTIALAAAARGPYAVTVTAADGTSSASQTFTWAVASPITLTVPADQTNYEGDTVSRSVSASDASGGTVTYAAVGLPPGLKINAGSGLITGTIAAGAAANGPYLVMVTASDGTYTASATFTWNVNCPITITNPGDQLGVVGQENVELQVEASSAVGGTLTYSASGLPKGLSINASNGMISGTIPDDPNAAGNFTVTITVSNGTYTAKTNFNWQVDGFLFIQQPQDTPVELVPVNVSEVGRSSPELVKILGSLQVAPKDAPNKPFLVNTFKQGFRPVGGYVIPNVVASKPGGSVIQTVREISIFYNHNVAEEIVVHEFVEGFPVLGTGKTRPDVHTVIATLPIGITNFVDITTLETTVGTFDGKTADPKTGYSLFADWTKTYTAADLRPTNGGNAFTKAAEVYTEIESAFRAMAKKVKSTGQTVKWTIRFTMDDFGKYELDAPALEIKVK
jgi:uncharacterized repeat protein (TIGR01451 family)